MTQLFLRCSFVGCFLVFAEILLLPGNAQPLVNEANWETSIVTIEVTRKQYDYQQPWNKRTRSAQKSGLVIGTKEILTAAEELFDRTLVRVQKGGRGKWWSAEVNWVDYHANLAVLSVSDDSFWQGLQPVELANGKPSKDGLTIVRWKNGNLERRRGEFSQYLVDEGRFSDVSYLQMEVSAEIQNVGWSEPVLAGRYAVGLTTGQNGNNVRVLPAAFIRPILEARKAGSYRGLGFFHFVWQPTENPSSFDFLQLQGEPRGAVVIDVPPIPGIKSDVKPRDILLQVDGYDIDNQGFYLDPDYGQLILENLSTRKKFAGDVVRLKVWRDGKTLDIDYTLPKMDYNIKLVPGQVFDQEPEYLIVGGLVFQPLTGAYLRTFGQDWRRSAPFRLSYYAKDNPKAERPAMVILTSVLPDSYNLGYQESRALVVDQVNGQKISRLADLEMALQKPKDGFHVIEFMKSDSLRKMVLDAGELQRATQRVLQQYGIANDRRLTAKN